MQDICVYIPEMTPALHFAAAQLKEWGISIVALPCQDVTHVLLSIPTKRVPEPRTLPDSITVFGGNLGETPYKSIDLLQDEEYLAQNAAITAHCAIKVALQHMAFTLAGCKALIIGWGRISKCLAPLLKAMGADVTIATRNTADRAILAATGFGVVDTGAIDAETYRLIFNTAPASVLDGEKADRNAVLIDLASQKGISGDNVIWARGLPGKEAPESSGILIARTVLRYLGKERI